MKSTILFCLMLLFAALSNAQSIVLPDANQVGGLALNVGTGQQTITAVYPNAEFTFSFKMMKLYVTHSDHGKEVSNVYDALLSQVTTTTYRAEVSPESWVELDTSTGICLVYQHCHTRLFTPASNLFTAVSKGE